MRGLALEYTYAYPHPSVLEPNFLRLATCTPQVAGSPRFFQGRLVRPHRTASLLRALMSIVRSRFHVPAAMLGRILAESDPVVTCSEERVRFEGFSACCGVYARVDLWPSAVEGEHLGRGTTNVDFNAPMLAALAMVREHDRVSLEIGREGVELTRNAQTVVERKVKLPVRWLKGFVEVQACQRRMLLAHEVSGQEAWRFFRALPRMKTHRRETFVAASGRGLRLSQVRGRSEVRVGGLERLRVLEDLAASARELRVYADAVTGASAWELAFDDCRFHVVLSPEVWRGFSGEGQALTAMAAAERDALLPEVRARLAWQAVIDEEQLHRTLAAHRPIDRKLLEAALLALGTQGLVGFDLAEGAWFHRELPFAMDQIEQQHPRLRDARKLVAENQVRLGQHTPQQVELLVTSQDVEHRVRLSGDDAKCTCPWYARHTTARGPCKHILAAHIFLEELPDEQ